MRRYYALPRFLSRFVGLKKNVRAKPAKLREIQEKKMRAIVRHAYQSVPFYHRLFDANKIKSTEIKTLDDLRRVPIVNRKEVQENLSVMTSIKTNISKCAIHKTSGSVGVPVTVIADRYAQEFRNLVSLRQFFECGGRLQDKQVQLRGQGALGLPTYSGKPLYERIGLFRTEWILPVEIDDSLLSFLEAYKPDVMVGYPSLFQLVAEKTRGKIKPRIVFCTGEILSDNCRDLLGSAFGTQVIDSYGCTETGDISWECPDQKQTGYHINADSVIVEFVRDDENVGASEEGEIVLTNLINYAMPFIRYKIGDVGIPSSELCPCGRTLPLMRLLKGRSDDFVTLPSGSRLSPLSILNMKNFSDVLEYRIIQKKVNLFEFWLKMSKTSKMDSVNKCISSLRKMLGDNVEIKQVIVDEIPRDKSGKLRRVISEMTN
jgi:phenylacetate-CoA ligase